MNSLLWTLLVLGAWNGLTAIARLICKEQQAPQYLWSVVLGFWAGYLLFINK